MALTSLLQQDASFILEPTREGLLLQNVLVKFLHKTLVDMMFMVDLQLNSNIHRIIYGIC